MFLPREVFHAITIGMEAVMPPMVSVAPLDITIGVEAVMPPMVSVAPVAIGLVAMTVGRPTVSMAPVEVTMGGRSIGDLFPPAPMARGCRLPPAPMAGVHARGCGLIRHVEFCQAALDPVHASGCLLCACL